VPAAETKPTEPALDHASEGSAVKVTDPVESPPVIPACAARFAGPGGCDVAIIGGGVVGLAIGWRLAEAGVDVAIFERGVAGRGASHAAAGMLAAAAECEPGEEALLELTLASQRLWPAFHARLEQASGLPVEYREAGILVLALGREEVDRLRFKYEFQTDLGLDLDWLDGRQARALEPALRAGTAAAVYSPGDHTVEARAVVAALIAAFRAAGGRLYEHCPVERLEVAGGRAVGVRLAEGSCRAETVILAAGAWSGGLAGLPAEARPPVRPLKGQALALRMDPARPLLNHTVWTEQIYLTPRCDGRLVIGATVEERGFDQSATAGGLYALLEATRRVLPGCEELPLDEIW
jgi:glycine oxidase